MESKFCKDSKTVKTSRVFLNDVNNHQTLFGGKLMSAIDETASISAARHCRALVVTASTDSVDFLHPINTSDSVCLESYVTWTGNSSMEVFVKVIAEDLATGERKIAATSFLTFVALDEKTKEKLPVPSVVPQSEEETKLHETAPQRAEARRRRREESKKFASFLTTGRPWE